MNLYNIFNIFITTLLTAVELLNISNAVYLHDDDDYDKFFTRRSNDNSNYSSASIESSSVVASLPSSSSSSSSLQHHNRNDILIQYSDNSNESRPKAEITTKTFSNNLLKTNPNDDDGILLQQNSNQIHNVTIKRRRDIKLTLCEFNNYCDCRRDTSSFITVDCDLYQKGHQYVFGSNNEIPSSATSLIVKLGPSAGLRIEEGIFDKSKINRVFIECTKDTNGHIELRPNAFKGNLAPFPDIEIVNCHTVVLRNNAFTGALTGEFKLNITNCHDVIIYSDAFYNTAFPAHFHNIRDLRIHEQAFNKARAKLEISNSNIENLYRFDASLREIRFFNCTISNINAGTFDVIEINSIVFERCKIDFIKTNAITEKLYSPHLAITGAIIGIIENEAINGSGISELILSENEIDKIQERAIYVNALNATITHNRIKHLGHEWFRVKEWSNITIAKNQFGDFGAMVIEKTAAAKACLFEGNFITNPQPGSLNITERKCIIREISFYKQCICKFDWLEKLSTRDLKSEAYCQLDESLKFCFNTSIINVLKYQHEVCDYTKSELDCVKSAHMKKIEGDFVKPEELEKNTWDKKNKLIYILIGIGILFVISACVFVIAHKIIHSRQSETTMSENASTNPMQHGGTLGGNGGGGRDGVGGTTLKEMKVFSNEDRRIINQTLEMMKQKYPPEIFELVYQNTQILLKGNITEIQRVKTIGDIVQTLGECENAGEDFVAFTDILYKHLAPTGGNGSIVNGDGNQPDPVYAEPTLPNHHDIPDDRNENIDGQTNVDHIYAEPNSVQQPLLTNEYASPADRNELVDLYSEPISNEKDRIIIPPYAVTSPKESQLSSAPASSSPASTLPQPAPRQLLNHNHYHQHPQQPPSTSSKNLPDVLNAASKPLTNVQKLAQNFSNDPTFHITRSPNTNRKIPKYTIPNIKAKQNEKLEITALDAFTPSSLCSSHPLSNNNNSNGSAVDSRSNHSGGSDVTVQIDDIIEYADA